MNNIEMTKEEFVDKMVTVINDIFSKKPVPRAAREIRNTSLVNISIDWKDLLEHYKKKYGKKPRFKMSPEFTFYNCDFINCKFTNMNLSSSIVTKCKIENCQFDSCVMAGIDFEKSTIMYVNINESQLIDSRFLFTEIYNSNITNSDLKHTNFVNMTANLSVFSTSEFVYSTFLHCSMVECHLCDCNMKHINFKLTVFNETKLTGTTKLDKTSSIERLTLQNYHNQDIPVKEHFVSVNNIGSRPDNTYYDYENDRVICGCWRDLENFTGGGSLKEFKKRVNKVYPDGQYHDEYMNAIAIFKTARKRYLDSKKG